MVIDVRELIRLEPQNKTAAATAERLLQLIKRGESTALKIDNITGDPQLFFSVLRILGLLAALSDNHQVEKHDEAIIKLVMTTKEKDRAHAVVNAGGIPLLFA